MGDLILEMDSTHSKESEKLMNLQVQFSYLNSLDNSLDTVTDLSIMLTCNLQLARQYSVLKIYAPLLHEHDINRLRRTGLKSNDLFLSYDLSSK